MNNTIYLERQCKVLVCADNEPDNQARLLVATIIKNIETFGYTFSKSVIDVLENSSDEYITSFYLRLVKDLKSITGAKRKFSPMYPNFPKQVMDASEAELYINAIIHYFGDFIGIRIMPEYEVKERMPMIEKTTLKVIGLGNKKDYAKMFTDLMSSKTSISDSDKADLAEYITTSKGKIDLPDTMPNKEVMSFVIPLLREHTPYEDKDLFHYCKTATDVLRLVTAMSDGDISLAENTRFKSFSRSDRRYLLSMLEHCSGDIVEDMFRFRKKWIRIGERLHPSEYPYKKVKSAFATIRKKGNVERFSTQVERALENCDIVTAAGLLELRPGDFARRLDHLVRSASRPSYVINRFRSVAHEVSTPLLLQVLTHFEHRNDGNPLRVVFPKGNVAKVQTIANDLPPISKDNCRKIVGVCKKALLGHYKKLEPIGKVYLDDRLSDYLVPFSQRSASKAAKTIVRGSKIDLKAKGDETIRFFLWWKNTNSGNRVDVDLSAVMYDTNWNFMEQVSYTNLKSANYRACHSGDITSAPKGACEFIDIDMKTALNYGARYIVMNVLSYTQQKYSEIPECFAGWMLRKKPQSGEIFDPKTVQNKIDLVSDTTVSIPMVIDLVERKVIWADLALKNAGCYNNIHSNSKNIALMGQSIESLIKPNLFDLFLLHVEARDGTLVDTKKDADVVFSVEDGVTPFDIEAIMGEYL